MAYSRVVAVGDGATTQFAVNFALDYLLETDVTCRVGAEVDGGGSPVYRPITFLSTNLLQVGGAPAGSGVLVAFERTVDKTALRVDYTDGDQLDEDNLMIAQKQAMMAVHEVLDGRFNSLTQDLNAGGFSIVNLREPTAATDVSTKNYVDTKTADAIQAGADAIAAAAAAVVSQAATAASATAAAGSNTAAQTAKTAAETARDTAISTVAGLAYASNAEALAGTATNRIMSPLRVAEVIAAGGGGGSSFVQSGTGALTLTMQDKARQHVSLLDFAKGDNIVDDTVAIQKAIDAFPSNVVLHGAGKTYKITAKLRLPAGSQLCSIDNANFSVTGDITLLDVVSGSALFFGMNRVYISAPSQTIGRPVIDISRMAYFTFTKVWVNGTANLSYSFYGAGTAGASPYYGKWDQCYLGNFKIGIMLQDAASAALGPNSNRIMNCRIQPNGATNIGIYLGAFSQDTHVDGCWIESPTGIGVYMDGTGHEISGDCRFEGLTTAISVMPAAVNCKIGIATYDSNTAPNIVWGGSSKNNNLLEWDPDNAGALSQQGGGSFGGAILSRTALGGVGYAAGSGAGGTVTQATNKTTGVTLNKVTGQITIAATSMVAGEITGFTFLNSAAGANDLLVINHISGGTVGAYTFNASCLGGAFAVKIRNASAVTLAESLVIQYALIKGSIT